MRCRDLPYRAFIRNAIAAEEQEGYIKLWDFKKELDKNLRFLQMDPSYAERSLNVGFSGGEKKKAEILTADDVKAITLRSWMRQTPVWMWTLSALYPKAWKNIRRIANGSLSDHHPQHQDSGVLFMLIIPMLW